MMNVKVILLSPDLPTYLVTSRQSPFPMKECLFNPKYYVMMEFRDNDYNLITFKKEPLLTFSMIPHKIKDLVVSRQLERNGGLYSFIPMFEKYKVYSTSKEQKQQDEQWGLDDLNIDQSKLIIHKHITGEWKPGDVPGEQIMYDDLLDWGMRIYRKEWRIKLDNHYIGKDAYFSLEDKEWSSVNHYVAAMQLRHSNPKKYEKLSRTSKSGLSKLCIPTDYNRMDLVYTAQFAKFSQNLSLKQLLLDTGTSKLYEYLPGQPAIELETLMKIRTLLS